jgi:hypothetical protein
MAGLESSCASLQVVLCRVRTAFYGFQVFVHLSLIHLLSLRRSPSSLSLRPTMASPAISMPWLVKDPGQTLKASMDEPYGNVPNLINFTKVVLIAGGSGTRFTVGVAIDLLRKLGTSQTTTVEFIWCSTSRDASAALNGSISCLD